MALKISNKTQSMPASAIRKLVPYSDAAASEGIKVYHLNVGARTSSLRIAPWML